MQHYLYISVEFVVLAEPHQGTAHHAGPHPEVNVTSSVFHADSDDGGEVLNAARQRPRQLVDVLREADNISPVAELVALDPKQADHRRHPRNQLSLNEVETLQLLGDLPRVHEVGRREQPATAEQYY